MSTSEEIAYARRAPRIKAEDVFQAADELLLQGDRPTIDRVRMKLGRGSPNTISDHLDAWWVKVGSRLRDLPGQELPEVPAPVSTALVRLWTEAIDQARTELHDTLAQQSAVLEQDRTALDSRASALDQARAQLAIERTALEQAIALLRTQLAEAQDRLRAGGDRIEALESECGQLLEQREQVRAELTAVLERLERTRAEQQEALKAIQERADHSERHWMRQVDEARQGLAAERKSAQAREAQHAAEFARLRTELADTHTALGQLRLQLAQANEARAALASENVHFKQQQQAQQEKAQAMLATLQDAQAAALARLESFHGEFQTVWSKSVGVEPADPPRGETDATATRLQSMS